MAVCQMTQGEIAEVAEEEVEPGVA